jgi:shikimate kinase/3-dehydroquinate synthase
MTNVIVTGFMGTGKTTVGQEVARRLGYPFVDMDTEIEARAGKPIPRIFAEDGEDAFRELEAALCVELSAQRGLVIATGGGALVDPTSRALMMRSGTVVCLRCEVDEILRRLPGAHSPERPLLDVADPRARIESLLNARREAYAAIPWQIDTTGCTVGEVAARVVEIANAITLSVRYPGGEYGIHIGNGVLTHAGGVLRAMGAPEGSLVAIVSNHVVEPLYGAQLNDSLKSAGLRPLTCSIPDGEQHKTLGTVMTLYEQFLAGGLDRSGTVLSLGGGVTGDVAGFAAATFMRGIRFVQVPTTLLAMVDASVGGKTGVDLPQGKNLIGAFKQPASVIIDPGLLVTLPPEEIRCGLAELIKHAIIGAPDFFAELEARAGALPPWQEKDGAAWIARSLQVKIQVVQEDPFEQGRRAVLNLGHTVGHALEKLSGFGLRHGEAVSIGMVAAAGMARELGWANASLADRIERILSAWGLPVRCPSLDVDAVCEALAFDKKKQGRGLRWVLPRTIGEVEIAEHVPPHVLTSVLHSMGARSKR